MRHFLFLLITIICFSAKAQQTEIVDFIKADATIGFKVDDKQVIGLVVYTFNILKDTDSVFLDAKKMTINSVYNDFGPQEYVYNNETIVLKNNFKKGNTYKVTIDYTVKPTKALYFVNRANSYQIWTQGQGKYTSNWLPSIDDMNDKIEFDLSLFFDKNLQAIANGKQLVKTDHGIDTVVKFNMQKPMSSYLVAIAIGKYSKKVITSKSGIPIELYYYPEDSAKVEPTYRYTKQMFDFLEKEIGVAYPWQNYKQVPVKDFLYAGMENTSLTIFSDDFMIDKTAFVDKNYVNVNAHELAHQWFGDLVTETEGKHHWLQEGFATYYALLAERNVFGNDYYFWKLFDYANELIAQEKAGNATSLLDPKASSITFYKKGAFVLHMLREEVGDDAFKLAVKNYLEKYSFKNVETSNFIKEVENTSNKDLTSFVDFWLISKEFNIKSIIKNYQNNLTRFISHAALADCGTEKCKDVLLDKNRSVLTKVNIVERYPELVSKKIFNNASLQVRQAIARNLKKTPLNYKNTYECLLHDKSYKTIEIALLNLWSNFPKDRIKYLETTKHIVGFNDKNVRCLWLALALLTEDYKTEFKADYFNELKSYTSINYGFKTRKNAFSYLYNLQGFDKNTLLSLVEAAKHHNWRFKSFASNLLKTLSKDVKHKEIIANLQDKQ